MTKFQRDGRARLSEIAEVLGVPIATLLDADEGSGPRPSPKEITRLVQAFTKIDDPQVRHHILAAAERAACAATD